MEIYNFIFDDNTLQTYKLWDGLAIHELLATKYKQQILRMDEYEISKYNFWLGLGKAKQYYIAHQISVANGDPIMLRTVAMRPAVLNFNQAANKLRSGKIVRARQIDNDYVELVEGNRLVYLVYARYNGETGELIPHYN